MLRWIVTISLVLALVVPCTAEVYKFEDNKQEPRKIEVTKEKDYLTVTVYPKGQAPIIYRVYPCGEVQKQEWKRLSENVERQHWGPSHYGVTLTPNTSTFLYTN